MTELFVLVNRPVAGQAQQTVNARELHAFLESKQEFSNWIKNRIEDYGFLDGVDFLTNLSKTQGRPRIDYFLSLDMAKELSMVERNAKGKQARQYFIDCEKRLSGSLNIPQTLPDALRLAADLAERNQQQAAQIAELAPKAEALARIEVAQGDLTVTQAAKMLKMQPKQLFDWLAQHGWLYRSGGSGVWLGYQDKVHSGYVTHSVYRYTSQSTGAERVNTQVYLTPKGMSRIAEKLGVAA
ncbi:phage antirepressor KilAC domain-containing protein [Kingella bonacorsii]|uniref:Phage antirepressor KilAC domain-containing protein n=1 Tax=Kingella bonacorsii TaxID=2796361 RepID=A0ABS1BQQ2_9NEIS|nr:phage antirepressor KilAC domain-containing protein [Kingella bonacorsii]MBK0395564.1 phage antirepressor KilAC domain-containing protein [Kingella bonacorsii]DAR72542.1 MAG TPA: KilAC domain protein [Caudoviricetes sp.]